MTYTDFDFDQLSTLFNLQTKEMSLFENVLPVAPSAWLQESLTAAKALPNRTEKAKSEAIVFPVLLEVRKQNNGFITIYSGENLNADPQKGLKGECDFIIAKETNALGINMPLLQVVEAKKHDLDTALPQCAAQMLGISTFNERKGVFIDPVYGCVTNGDNWIFLKLEKQVLYSDNRIYYANEIPLILGVFQQIISEYKAIL
jgi:hypothetical protein